MPKRENSRGKLASQFCQGAGQCTEFAGVRETVEIDMTSIDFFGLFSYNIHSENIIFLLANLLTLKRGNER